MITEQVFTDTKKRQIIAGGINKKNKGQIEHDRLVLGHVEAFDFDRGDVLEFLDIMEVVLQFDNNFVKISDQAIVTIDDVADS